MIKEANELITLHKKGIIKLQIVDAILPDLLFNQDSDYEGPIQKNAWKSLTNIIIPYSSLSFHMIIHMQT